VAEDGVIRAVSAQLRDADISESTVRAVFTAWSRITGGDAVGTVLEDPATGNIAVRVSRLGELYWHVIGLDASVSNDQQGTIPGWDVLKSVS